MRVEKITSLQSPPKYGVLVLELFSESFILPKYEGTLLVCYSFIVILSGGYEKRIIIYLGLILTSERQCELGARSIS